MLFKGGNMVKFLVNKRFILHLFLITVFFLIVFAISSCDPGCNHCKVKIRVINLPNECSIRESFCKIAVGTKEQLNAINQGIPTRLLSKVFLRRYPALNPENIGEFDVDCNKGIVVSYMYIQFDDCCPTGSGNAFYYFDDIEIYSYIFANECEPTLTYDFLRDFIFAGCM